jgi:tetratricopeptide (TPR) repeat protein/TolB-like protein
MGEILLAEDTRLLRRVALKGLTESWSRRPEARRRLVHEARAVAALNHPNIAAVYDVVESAETTWIVMEFVPGETLAAKLRLGPLDPTAAVYIGRQLCDALGEAHGLGIVHRDLKPANMMLMPDGRLKVLDFGLAQALAVGGEGRRPEDDIGEPPEGTRRLIGTLPYLPPEHILGTPVDERSDLYSAGVVLFELLTGRLPFDGRPREILEKIVSGRVPRVRELAPYVSETLDDLVARAMARRPEDRPATAAALGAGLGKLNERPSDPQTLPSDLPTAPQPSLRRATHAAAWSAGLVAAVVALAAIVYVARRPAAVHAHAPVVAVLPLLDAGQDARSESLGLGLTEVVVASLSRLPGANVLSPASTSAYRERGRNAMDVARELGLDFVVDGLVQQKGDRVRVTLSLVQAPSGIVAWSRVYDGPLSDVFGLQSGVAQEVASALRLRLSPEERARVARPRPAIVGDAFSEYASARGLFESGDIASNLDRSVLLFESALRREPAFALAAAGLGQACWAQYKRTHDPAWADRARDATRKALDLDPDQPAVRVALAEIDLGTGQLDDAEHELREAIAQQPDNDEAEEALGRVLAERGRRDEAIAALRRAVELRPAYWQHLDALGLALFDAGRYWEAADAFRRVTRLRPESGRAFHQLGTVLQAMGDRKGALASYERGLALEPDGDTWSNVGSIHYAEGRFAHAADAFARAVALVPNAPSLHRNLGDAYRRLGRSDESRAAYREAIRLTEKQLEINPRDGRNWSRLAVYHAKLGEAAAAAAAAEKAMGLAPTTADVLYNSAVARALCREAAAAAGLLERAFDAGYSRELARDDDDLAALRREPGVERLLSAGIKKEEGRRP